MTYTPRSRVRRPPTHTHTPETKTTLFLEMFANDFTTSNTDLNEELVQLLLLRDELHVEQDAMLVDIEDLTR